MINQRHLPDDDDDETKRRTRDRQTDRQTDRLFGIVGMFSLTGIQGRMFRRHPARPTYLGHVRMTFILFLLS